MKDHYQELKDKARKHRLEHYGKKAEAIGKLLKHSKVYVKDGCNNCDI